MKGGVGGVVWRRGVCVGRRGVWGEEVVWVVFANPGLAILVLPGHLFRPIQFVCAGRVSPPKGGGPEGWGPYFRVFSLSRHNFLSFFSLLGVFS